MINKIFKTTVLLGLLSFALNPVLAYSNAEQAEILGKAELASFDLPERNGLTGGLAARSRSLEVLSDYISGDDGCKAIVALFNRDLLPEASLGGELGENHDACGPNRFFAETIFCPAQINEDSAFFLYDPSEMQYSFGGVIAAGETVEALVKRVDGFVACMRQNGRVIFVAESGLNQLKAEPIKIEAKKDVYTGSYRYRKMMVGKALIHMAEVDLSVHPFSTTVSPYYNAVKPGSERTLYVDELARRAGAKIAINGTFFNMKSTSELYGWPVGSFFADDQLVYSFESPSLNALNRSYVAFTDAGKIVIGETTMPGSKIQQLNQNGQFDAAKFGNSRIRAFGGGFGWLVKDGNAQAWKEYAGKQFDPSFYSRTSRRARSLLGVDATGKHLFFLAEEEGSASPSPMSHPELAEYIVATTNYKNVVFLDGGGSTQMVINGKNVSNPLNSGGYYRKNSTALLLMPR